MPGLSDHHDSSPAGHGQDRVDRGIELFNSGLYWEAHEVWEEAWTADRRGPDSGFFKGLIQIAAGCLHHGRDNRRGAVNKWRSGAAYLRPYLPAHRAVALAPLVAEVNGFLEAYETSGSAAPELTMPRIHREGSEGLPTSR